MILKYSKLATVCGLSTTARAVKEEFSARLQAEIAREPRIIVWYSGDILPNL
jgi:hypothetical protein